MPIRMLPRRPCSVRSPGVRSTASRSSAVTCDVVAQHVELVRPVAEGLAEDLGAHRHQVGVRHPRAVEAGRGLAGLVLADLGERALVDLGVAPARDERRHPADRERPAPVAGVHQQVAVGLHHRRVHGDGVPVGQRERRPGVAEVLDDAEQVVPAAGVEPGHVVAQLVEDLVHLERRGDRLDQHRRADRAVRDLERGLGVGEHVVPEPRLEVGLHLRQVEVRPAAARELLLRVVEEVEAEVDQRGHRRACRRPARCSSSKCQPRGRGTITGIRSGSASAYCLPSGEVNSMVRRTASCRVTCPPTTLLPVRRVRVLEVGQPHAGAGVEGVDRHLPLGRAGDLDPPVLQVGRRRRDRPVAVADPGGPGEEVEPAGARDRLAPLAPRREQLVAACRRTGAAGRPRSRGRRA